MKLVDMHQDMLSMIIKAMYTRNFTWVEKNVKAYQPDNIVGLAPSLYFMNQKEMDEELSKYYWQEDSCVLDLLKISLSFFLSCNDELDLIPTIEGCDKVAREELKELYEWGLRSITLVWDNENQYGSGNRNKEKGLTEAGKDFLKEAINLGIGIDLSHANQKTFDDMINLIQEEQFRGKRVLCYCSHSNAYHLAHRDRNLTDDQLKKLPQVGGYIGVVAHRRFCMDTHKNGFHQEIIPTQREQEQSFLNQINYIKNFVDIDHIFIATDQMNFATEFDKDYDGLQIFKNYQTIAKDMYHALTTLNGRLSCEEANQVMYQNAQQLFQNCKLTKEEKEKIKMLSFGTNKQHFRR